MQTSSSAILAFILRGQSLVQRRKKQMRRTVIVAAATALITAIISIWTTTVIIAHTQMRPETALASSSVDLTQMISDANKLADEKADPVD